jgi:Glycosyl transferase family 64 domain
MITFVVLNWRRQANVDAILSAMAGIEMVDERIVWNNNPNVSYSNEGAVVINSGRNFGCDARYAVATLARNDCVLCADDDLRLPAETISALYAAWSAEPEIVHGLYPRVARPDGSYARWLNEEPGYIGCQTIILAGRTTMFSRSLLPAFFEVRTDPAIKSIRDQFEAQGGCPNNGDDIVMSYAAFWLSGRLNRGHNLPVIDLPAPHAVSAHRTHGRIREQLMRQLDAMTAARKLPLCTVPA